MILYNFRLVRLIAQNIVILQVASHPGGLLAQQGSPPRPGWLVNHATYISAADLPHRLVSFHEMIGQRMTATGNAKILLVGTVTDSKGSRSAQISVQSPGYLAYRDTNSRTLVYDGTEFKTKKGGATDDDDPIAESLLAHLPDSLLLQVASGGSFRRLGSNFRPDASRNAEYSGSLWTVFAFSPAPRPGLAKGKALQQDLFIAVDNRTNLLTEVRSTVVGSGGTRTVQTTFSNWTQSSGQWYPATVVRLENGTEMLRFQMQQASTGAADPVSTFVP